MTNAPLTNFEPDSELLAVIHECMAHYDIGDPDAQWPNNLISRKAVVYGSGLIAREGDAIRHAVDPVELALCHQLAAEVEELMMGVSVGMGSQSDDEFHGFFIAGSVGESVPSTIDETLIRSRFGGTIFPPATITIEPLTEGTSWWAAVEQDGEESEDDYFVTWRTMIQWFSVRPEFTSSAFVQIGDHRSLHNLPPEDWPEGTESPGCVLPRLAVGLTHGGSLIGLFGYSVQT